MERLLSWPGLSAPPNDSKSREKEDDQKEEKVLVKSLKSDALRERMKREVE